MYEMDLKDEKQINFYSYADRSHDARTKRYHPTPYTGRDSVRIRNYRAAVVCLLLLCVLLLTAVIGLCVHIHTKSTNLTEEKDGWISYQFSLYFISTETKSWTESKRYCMDIGADLIIINNKEEQNFVTHMADGAKFWIGLTDSDVEGRWKWVDGRTMTFGFWATGETNGYGGENCALSETKGWADYPCNEVFKCICEKNIRK